MKRPMCGVAFLTAAALVFGGLFAMEAPAPAAVPAAPTVESQAPAAPFKPGGRDLLILLDTSGSMADKDSNGVVKIGAAKSAILEQIQQLPVTARVGLMTYPSGSGQTPSGCSPAQLRVPVSSSSVADMGAALGALPKPDGGTPTSDALLKAGDYLKAEALTDVTIVLVSDGESNCGGNPCETARKLKAENINVTVNTVGFDISKSGQSELECVAAAAGGIYVTAQDASQLTQVLKDQFGSGLGLSITSPSAPVPMLEETFGVGIIVSVAAGHGAANVQLQLTDTDPNSGSTVRRPVMSMGNLGAGTSIPTKWLIRPPTNPKLDQSTFKITVKTNGLTALSKEFTVSYTHDQPTGANLSGSLKDFKNVAVLGDSYSSGEGAGDAARPYFQVGDQAQSCHRTKNQYANWLYSPEQVRVLACSGAVSLNVYADGQNGEKNQLTQLDAMLDTGYRPDAIFLSITGNDIGFEDIAKACAWSALRADVKDALIRASTLPVPQDADPLASCPASETSGQAYQTVQDLISHVKGYVFTVLVRTGWIFTKKGIEVPPIIVLEYPQLLARDPSSPLRCDGNHPFQTVVLGAAFQKFAVIQNQLNQQIQNGVQDAKAKKALPVYLATTATAIPPGHSMCSAEPWFVPLTLNGAVVQRSPEVLHPNVAGHQAIAAKINGWAAASGTDLKPAKSSVGPDPAWKDATLQWWPTASEIYVPMNQPGTDSVRQDSYGRTIIHVTGGAPLTGTTIYVHSTPLVLGHLQLNDKGEGSLTVDLQATDLPPGDHTVNVLGTGQDGKPVVSTVHIHLAQPFPSAFWIIGLIATLLLVISARILRNDKRPKLAIKTNG